MWICFILLLSCSFQVNEIVVFNDTNEVIPSEASAYTFLGKQAHSAWMLASILQYVECPPHLRKFIFPKKREFELAHQMNPLNVAHHQQDHPLYRFFYHIRNSNTISYLTTLDEFYKKNKQTHSHLKTDISLILYNLPEYRLFMILMGFLIMA